MSQLALVHTRAQVGLRAPAVSVEVHLSAGLPALNIVGLPEAAVRESKDRVRSALINSGFDFPTSRMTVNLAPADLPKEGGRFDLPIALGILAASGQLPATTLANRVFMGELALSGALRPITGVLPAAMTCQSVHELIVPASNGAMASLARQAKIVAAHDLLSVCAHVTGQTVLPAVVPTTHPDPGQDYPDLSEVRGQPQAKRALVAAAAGGHHIVFFGPPGTGKTMLASRLPGILPKLEAHEALEVAAIHSLTTRHGDLSWGKRPFRNPHHSSSPISLVGGGSPPKPGEISYAHQGVLFLDEMPEFQRQALDMLREPLENGEVVITRAKAQERYPALFQLVAAMNPCPCGYLGDHRRACCCTPQQISRYRHRLSGPLIDRIDLQVEVAAQSAQLLLDTKQAKPEDSSTAIRNQVEQARARQRQRQSKLNAQLSPDELQTHCHLQADARDFINNLCDKMAYSARAMHRIMRVARTLADLSATDSVRRNHLAEAVHYRRLDRTATA